MSKVLDYGVLLRDPKLAESFDVYMCNGFSLPSFAIRFLKDFSSSFEAREDDIYVVSYPKTGTTWTQEIVYLVHSDLDFEGSRRKNLNERFPYVEHAVTDVGNVKDMKSPRLIKSHLPYSLLPPDIINKKCKIIYVTRNPKDVVVSYYHFACWLKETNYRGSFDQFFERFVANRTTYSPFLMHNLEFWKHRNDSNILFLFYEDMHKDLAASVQQISSFLGKTLSNDDVKKIVNHCSFQNMSKSESVTPSTISAMDGKPGKFFRKGQIGDWKNYLSEEQSARIDKLVEDTLCGTGLKYTYEC